MTASQRIVVNTIAQYTRTFINVVLSLYSTRLILAALGQSDFGIFSLVGGVISMLSFITNALAGVPQRFLSIYHGAKQSDKLSATYANCMLLHLMIGGALLLILAAVYHPVLYHVLNIEPERITAGIWVYFSAGIVLLLTFVTAPIRALFIARENIVYTSVVEVLDGVFKLLIAIFLTVALGDKLILYSVLLIGISLFNLCAYLFYAMRHYDECHVPRIQEIDWSFIKQIFRFAAWNIYASGCIIIRSQGLAVLFNRFYSVIVNAAYGIALQVTGATNFLAYSILNAMSPQIMKAEGAGDRKKEYLLAAYASKYGVLLQGIVLIPIVFELPAILTLWLGEVPEYSVVFSAFMLIASVIDQLTIGLTAANQAIGKLRIWNLTVNTSKLLALPVGWVCLHYGMPLVSVLWAFITFELVSSLLRIPVMHLVGELEVMPFIRTAILPIFIPMAVNAGVCYAMTHYVHSGDDSFRFFLTGIVAVIITGLSILLFATSKWERQTLLETIKQRKNK